LFVLPKALTYAGEQLFLFLVAMLIIENKRDSYKPIWVVVCYNFKQRVIFMQIEWLSSGQL